MNSLQLALIIAAIVAVMLLFTWWMGRRREHVWQQFARANGLEFLHGRHGPEVRGTIGGRDLALQCARRSSDRGELGAEEVKLVRQLHGPLPRDLQVASRPLIESEEKHAAATIPTGDETFDSKTHVTARDPDELKNYLTPARREALLKILSMGDPGQSSVETGNVNVVEREIFSSLDHLDERLKQLEPLLPILDA